MEQGPNPTAAWTARLTNGRSGLAELVALTALVVAGDTPASARGLQQQVFGSDTSAGDTFGDRVAIQGDRAVVGAEFQGTTFSFRPGAAYVFERGPTGWVEVARLASPVPANNERFGSDVALDGDRIVVGAYGSDQGTGQYAGAAYVFDLGPGGWQYSATLAAPAPAFGDLLGNDVDLEGDRVVVGMEDDENAHGGRAGSVLVFERVAGAWGLAAELSSATTGAGARLGMAVDLDGDRILAGAPLAAGGPKALVFEFDGLSWSEVAVLQPSDTGPGFGYSVALDGDHAAAGAWSDDGFAWNSGAVHLFERSGGTWSHTRKLLPADQQADAYFGREVALELPVLLVSAHRADLPSAANAGRVHHFELDGSGWHELGSLSAAAPLADVNFGRALALSAGTVATGSPEEASLGIALGHGNGTAWFTRWATLTSSPGEVSLATGGLVSHALDLGPAQAGRLALLFGSASGIGPGTPVGPLEVPLVVDGLTLALLPQVGGPLAPGYLQVLDLAGRGTAGLLVPPATDPGLAGVVLYHAGLVLDLAGAAVAVTNPTRTLLAP
jgi:hypothetical protein